MSRVKYHVGRVPPISVEDRDDPWTPQRFQYRPLSLPITFLHSAWWDWRVVEFSVWRTYKHDRKTKSNSPEPWQFRVNIGRGRLVLEGSRARSWRRSKPRDEMARD